MKALVGYTGFVGGNLFLRGHYDRLYNSKNIEEAFGTKPDVLYFAGIGAEKFLANTAPEKDCAVIENAMRSVEKIRPKSIVLISTVDVYKNPDGVDERSGIETDGLHPYGLNRYRFEQFVSAEYPDHLIVRLPGLYGENLKKNFIYDMIHFLPSMLNERKMNELNRALLEAYYIKEDNGFYKLRDVSPAESKELTAYFEKSNFSALSFTDSRTSFQFYNLKHLSRQIEQARREKIRLLHVATEPCRADELYRFVFGKDFSNHVTENPPHYDMRSKYSELFGGKGGYFFDKCEVMADIKRFVEEKRTGLE